jgi:hypothetical protein
LIGSISAHFSGQIYDICLVTFMGSLLTFPVSIT